MSVNGADDTTPGPTTDDLIKDPGNRELVTFLGNMVIETRHQFVTLRSLYDLLRDMTGRPPIDWQHQLLTSQEQHIDRVTEHVAGLKTALRAG